MFSPIQLTLSNIPTSGFNSDSLLIGIIVTSAAIVGTCLIVDHYDHELVANTPIANQIVKSTYAIKDSIVNLFYKETEVTEGNEESVSTGSITPKGHPVETTKEASIQTSTNTMDCSIQTSTNTMDSFTQTPFGEVTESDLGQPIAPFGPYGQTDLALDITLPEGITQGYLEPVTSDFSLDNLDFDQSLTFNLSDLIQNSRISYNAEDLEVFAPTVTTGDLSLEELDFSVFEQNPTSLVDPCSIPLPESVASTPPDSPVLPFSNAIAIQEIPVISYDLLFDLATLMC